MKKVVEPRKLWEHSVAAFRLEFTSFDRRKCWNDLLYGTGIEFVGLLIGWIVGTSIRSDFDEHPVAIVVISVLPVSILAADVARRCLRALRRVYRERSQKFRETIQVLGAIAFGSCLFAMVIWYGYYETSPHFYLEIQEAHAVSGAPNYPNNTMDGEYLIGNTDDIKQPSTLVLFALITVHNTGTASSISHWKLRAKVPGVTDEVEGEPNLNGVRLLDPRNNSTYLTFAATDLIFGRGTSRFRGTVQGTAKFIVSGVAPETLRFPGTKLTVSCQDDYGRTYEITRVVTAKETTLKTLAYDTGPPNPTVDPGREVIVTHVDVAPFQVGYPVELHIHVVHTTNPDDTYNAYFKLQVGPSVIGRNNAASEQPNLENHYWDGFAKEIKTSTPPHFADINLPFKTEAVLTQSSTFTDHVVSDLIHGRRSLYIAGMIIGKTGKPTPLCVIRAPRAQDLWYCKDHN